MHEDKKIGLVFSGGGARGAYQVGAWQAMNELGITPSITAVYGTSVGAINGAAFVQGDIGITRDIWHQLSYNKVFANHPNIRPSFKTRRAYLQWIKGAFKQRGMDVSPLKDMLRVSLDETLIRSNPIDFGVVVYDLTSKKSCYLNAENLPDGQLVEFVIASATFPTFKPHRIGDKLYLDGGISDNRPMQFFKNNSDIDLVICIDVTAARHFWPNKSTKGDHEVFFVRPSRLLGSPLAFNLQRIESNLKLGYEDTRRQLGAYFSVG